MIHHVNVMLSGLAFFLLVIFVPMLLGLPAEAWGSNKAKVPFRLGRAWFGGAFVIVALSFIYIVGLFFN
jgi:hypothetical protein